SQLVPRESGQGKKGPYADAPSADPPESPRAKSERQLPPDRYETRIAQVACCDAPDPDPSPTPDDTAAPGPDVLGRATAGVARTALTLHAVTLP
ncbi:hydrolase, partial [Streptomyces sp. NPDC056948]